MLPLNDAARGALQSLLRETLLSPGKVRFAWTAVVGPAVERATTVRLEGDTLVVEASSAQWAREVSRSTPVIVRRLQGLLGNHVIRALRIRAAPACSEAGSPKPEVAPAAAASERSEWSRRERGWGPASK